jgi:hypothetical protein
MKEDSVAKEDERRTSMVYFVGNSPGIEVHGVVPG